MKRMIQCSILVAVLVIASINSIGGSNDNFEHEVYQLLRIHTIPLDDAVLPYADIVGGYPGEYLDVIYPLGQQALLEANQITYEVLIDDIDTLVSETGDNYHTFTEMVTFLETIVETYPSITLLKSIGTTFEGNDIWCLEISDNPGIDEKEPGVVFMGVHHAREWPTLEICLHLIETLTSAFGKNDSLTHLIDERRIWIIPCVNPDGFIYDHDENAGTPWWRKNRNYFEEFNTYGVDLNRNYGGSCNGYPLAMWGSTGMSHDPANDIYCGPAPFSEIETQSIRNLFLEEDICATISWHTYSELVLWPWGYSLGQKTPDDNYMAEVGREIASRITTQDGMGTYTPTQSAGLYPTTGDTTDWAYGYYHYILGKPLFAYTIEACSSFHPDEQYLSQICKENVDGALYLLQEAENISALIPRVLPPTIDEVGVEPDGSFILSWTQKNQEADATQYHLEELSNLYLFTDTCEIGDDAWVLSGFSKTNKESYSGSLSYTSGEENNKVTSMTLKDPLYVEEGMVLSFSCFYDIEENYDKASIEVSVDGRSYEVLDTFTGTSSRWISKDYSLEPYIGTSIIIRFRYSTDSLTVGKGFFVDDIAPVPLYRAKTVLSETISEDYYQISFRPDGEYFYQVKGYNEAYGWGDVSILTKVSVQVTDNTPPGPPRITGVSQGRPGTLYEFTISASDVDLDHLFYYVSWGDGSIEEWIGPYGSDEEVTIEHVWSEKGDYVIKVRAKDEYQLMGDWSIYPLSMPQRTTMHSLLFRTFFLKRFFSALPFIV